MQEVLIRYWSEAPARPRTTGWSGVQSHAISALRSDDSSGSDLGSLGALRLTRVR